MGMTLYGERLWDSPFVFTVYVALEEKGIPFEERSFDLQAGEHRRGDFPLRSITGKVPALEHDGFWLAESMAIVEYLEERFAPPEHAALLPEGIEERARARQVLAWLRSDLHALRRDRSSESIFYERATEPLTEQGRADAQRLIGVAGRLLPAGRATLFSRWCIADADLAFMLHRLILNGDPVPADLREYAARVWERPSVQAFVRHPRPDRTERSA